MTEIYLIRHAEAEGNLYRRVHGHYDSLITERGLRQIACLEKRFADIHIDAVYSSDLFRTMKTASAIYKSHGLPLQTTPLLREVGVGAWEDIPWGDVETFEPEKLRQFNYDPLSWHVAGSESYADVRHRMVEAICAIAAQHDGQVVAAASHGSAIRMLLAHVLEIPGHEIGRIPPCDNTGVALLRVEGERIEVVYMNDNSHLDDGLSTLAAQKWWKSKDGAEGTNLRFVPMTTDADFAQYMVWRRDAWLTIHGTERGFSEAYLYSAKHRASLHPSAVVTAYLGHEPAGVMELAVEMNGDREVGEIGFVCLDSKFRKMGMGVQLIGHAVSVYRSMGCKKLRLRVAEENAHGIHFYEKYGFRRKGSVPGAIGKLYVYEKNIAFESLD